MLGQVALEEEAGKATNGLGFAVVDRGPRELLELATPEQVERFVAPILRGEYREAWALTEPGAGSDLAGLPATAVRDGDDWVLNGEKWFVTSEGDPGVYVVAAVADGEQTLFLVEPGHAGTARSCARPRFLHDPYVDHHPEIVLRATAACPTRTASRRRRRGREGVDPRRAAVHRGPLLRRRDAAARPRERLGAGARGVRRADRRVPGRLVPARRLADRAARGAAPHLPRGPRVRHARRPQDRPRQGVDGEALRLGDGRPDRRPRACRCSAAAATCIDSPAARHLPRAARRPDLGGHERDPAR